MTIITALPAGFQSRYFRSTESETCPVIRREHNTVVFPAFVRQESRTDGGTVYRYYEVKIPFVGQDLADDAGFAMRSYAALRHHLYGTPEQQSEMRDDCRWEAHRQAVRSAFPKSAGAVNEAAARFEAIKTEFWLKVDAACAAVGKTRDDLPATFNAEEMLAFAATNGMSAADIAAYTSAFAIVSLNLLQNNRNWEELF